MRESIDGASFAQAVIHAAASLNLRKQEINELNVFPVPDGDTGTNMSLTLGTAATELRQKQPRPRGAAASTSDIPSLERVAMICRFRLDRQSLSASMRSSAPT